MSLKLKIVLGMLLLIAGFLVIRLGLFFKHSVKTATLANIDSQIATLNEENFSLQDSDHDGIPDANEAYYRTDPSNPDTDGDGYLDGEEIVSGFRPTKKDGLDERSGKTGNATASLAEHVVAGIYAGDLSPKKVGNKKFKDNIDLLALATIDEANGILNPPPVSDAGLTIVEKSKESQNEYLTKTAALLEGPFLNSFMQQPYTMNRAANLMIGNKYAEATEIFRNSFLTYSNAYSQLIAIPVPRNWIDFHRHLLGIFQKISLNYLSLTKIADDPLLALMALQDLQNNLLEIDFSLIQELKILIQTENLEIPNSPLFNVLNLLDAQ